MNIGRSILFPRTAALRPGLACEIAAAGIVAARAGKAGQEFRSAFASLPAGVFFTGLKEPGFSGRAALVSALRQVLDEVSQRDTKLTLLIPDSAVRVLLLDFDTLPSKNEDVLPIVRFRLRKLVPFEVEKAAISYQRMAPKDGAVRVLCAVSPAAVLGEYESAVREAGYEPGVVLPSTLAALAGISGDEPSLVVHRNGDSFTTAIARGNELLLHRTLEGSAEMAAETDTPAALRGDEPDMEWTAAASSSFAEDLRQSVSVAIAYYEDTLQSPPRQLLAMGAGGAEALLDLLGGSSIPVRDLAPPSMGNLTAMPPGLLAGVQGALAG